MAAIEQLIPYGGEVESTYDTANFGLWDPDTQVASIEARPEGVLIAYEPGSMLALHGEDFTPEAYGTYDDYPTTFYVVDPANDSEDHDEWCEEIGTVEHDGVTYIVYWNIEQD